MSCTPYTEQWVISSGLYDSALDAYDSASATYDGILFTVYAETTDVSTSYSEVADVTTSYTEQWGELGTPGMYDSASDSYDESARTYDGILYTTYSETADQYTTYQQKGLCMELLNTDGQEMESTDGEQLTVTNL